MLYRIGDVEFNPAASEIVNAGQRTHLQPQVCHVLECLARHHGKPVSRDLIFTEAWQGRDTSDECLTRCISLLREHFHDRDQRHLIETIPRVGYRLTGTVEARPEEPSVEPASRLPFFTSPNRFLKLVTLVVSMLVMLSGWVVAAGLITLYR